MTARKTPARKVTTPAPMICNSNSRGTYTGRELMPFAGRPGAMDAFRLPSRIGNDVLVPRAVREGKL